MPERVKKEPPFIVTFARCVFCGGERVLPPRRAKAALARFTMEHEKSCRAPDLCPNVRCGHSFLLAHNLANGCTLCDCDWTG